MKLHYLVILSVLCPALAFAQDQKLPAPPGQDGFIYFTADNASVDPVSKKVNLKGNVVITQETKDKKRRVVTGEDITLDQAKTQISSAGTMTVKTADATLTGQDMSVNYTTKDFTAHNIATQYPPLRVINAKEISSKTVKKSCAGPPLLAVTSRTRTTRFPSASCPFRPKSAFSAPMPLCVWTVGRYYMCRYFGAR